MGCGPVLRADGPFGSSLVAAFGQLEPDEADRIERCFGHNRSGWWFVFVGCRRKNGHLFGLGYRLWHRSVVDV